MLQLLEARTEKEPQHIIKNLRHVKMDIGHDYALEMAWECLDEKYSTDHVMAHTCAMSNPMPKLPTGCQPSNPALRGASPGPYYLGHCIQFRLTISHSNCNQCHLQAKEVTAGIACQPILQRLHPIKLLTSPGYEVKLRPSGSLLCKGAEDFLCRS